MPLLPKEPFADLGCYLGLDPNPARRGPKRKRRAEVALEARALAAQDGIPQRQDPVTLNPHGGQPGASDAIGDAPDRTTGTVNATRSARK